MITNGGAEKSYREGAPGSDALFGTLNKVLSVELASSFRTCCHIIVKVWKKRCEAICDKPFRMLEVSPPDSDKSITYVVQDPSWNARL